MMLQKSELSENKVGSIDKLDFSFVVLDADASEAVIQTPVMTVLP